MNTGDEFIVQCPKCKLLLNHRVTVAFEGTPIRVMCLTCKKERTVKKKARASNIGKTDPRPYDAKEVYKVGDTIYHKHFGEGEVKGADKEKITVLFIDKERMFLHGQ